MPEPFTPQHLTAEEIGRLYAPLLKDVEAQVLTRWQACVAAPHSAAAEAHYREALAHLEALRRDCERLTGGETREGQDGAEPTDSVRGVPLSVALAARER